MSSPTLFTLTSLVVLPFRADVAAGASEVTIGRDTQPTVFALAYSPVLSITEQFHVPTELCTFISIEFPYTFNGEAQQLADWLLNGNGPRVIRDAVLPRLNHFLPAVQAADDDPFRTIALRNVGELDLLFHNISLEGEVRYSRGTSTFHAGRGWREEFALPRTVQATLAPEWLLMTRAVHLVNHGFLDEAVLVAFALLDLQVQRFLAPRFPHLDSEHGQELLDAVEAKRLTRYLGLMMRVATGSSPLDDIDTAAELSWLNGLRNDIIHRAQTSSMSEAQRALRIVKTLLEFLNQHGAELELPTVLRFWTPD